MTVIDPAVTSPTGCADAAAIIAFVSAHRESMVRVAGGYVQIGQPPRTSCRRRGSPRSAASTGSAGARR